MISHKVKLIKTKYSKYFLAAGILLICLGLVFPVIIQRIWFNAIIRIREAIISGDSGHLILASATINFLYAIQNTTIFMGTMLAVSYSKLNNLLKPIDRFLMSITIIILLHWTNSLLLETPWEPVPTVLAYVITLYLFERLFGVTNSFIQVFIVSIQVFFAFNWLNIMPLFSYYKFGQSDISYSIKIVGIYLNAVTVLNFAGFAFFLPFIISAFITATLFISYSQNIRMMRDNYTKENEIRNMKAKALESRIYQEVKSLVHDLKTPLVTIRGLNSLMLSCDGNGNSSRKIAEYSERIENSVVKMSEMISSFLYESSRQKLRAAELMCYIRAQLPLEDEKIKFVISIEEELPDLYVNKIRIARAVINILENAILVPYKHSYKLINVEVKACEGGINIIIRDNGIGIKESELHRIWEVGYSTNNTSGLGLPFAKNVIEDNEGTITVHSKPDIGTKVTIFLPAAVNGEESEN